MPVLSSIRCMLLRSALSFIDFAAAAPALGLTRPQTSTPFTVNGRENCGRVNPNAGATAAQSMKLRADLSNMHLIDDSTGKVL